MLRRFSCCAWGLIDSLRVTLVNWPSTATERGYSKSITPYGIRSHGGQPRALAPRLCISEGIPLRLQLLNRLCGRDGSRNVPLYYSLSRVYSIRRALRQGSTQPGPTAMSPAAVNSTCWELSKSKSSDLHLA